MSGIQDDSKVTAGILAASPDCVKVLSVDGAVLFMNERGVELNQLRAASDVLGKNFADMWPEEEREKVRAAITGAAAGRVTRMEGFCPTAKGEARWWEASFAPMLGDGPTKIVGISRDITDRIKTQDMLADARERLEANLSNVDFVGIWDWHIKSDRVFADERFAKLFSVDPALAAAGAPIGDFLHGIHPDDRERVGEEIAEAMKTSGKAFVSEYRVQSSDGSIRYVMARGQAAFDESGKPNRFPGVVVDITGQRKSLERGRTWDLTPDLLGVLNEQGYFEITNPAWQSVLGYTSDEISQSVFFDFLHPDDLKKNQKAFAEALQGQPVFRFENRYRHRNGSYRWLSWVAIPERNKIYCSARDISAEKQAELDLAEAQEALRQAQKMEAIGQLTGGVAHDFNNLLTVIRSSVELLGRPNLSEERRARYIGAIAETVTRASKLTGQLLAFARRQALKPEVFDVCQSVQGLHGMMRTLTGSRIRLKTDVSDQPCMVDADPSQFDTAIVNMVVNARDAMDGEGDLTIAVEPVSVIPPIRTHAAVHGDFVAVCITDTGSGISEEHLNHIFEPFFTTKGVGQGTGLGLSQVFGFSKQSGGEIRVDSHLGKGSTFVLYLPRTTAKAETPEPDVEMLADGHGTRVLVVEDNVEVGRFTTQALAELGYETVWAADAGEALVHLAKDESRFDVVFSDVVMPGDNGVDLAQKIRDLYRNLPVVLTSGYSHVLAQGGTHGFELVHKPYSLEQLSRTLQKVAAARRRERSRRDQN